MASSDPGSIPNAAADEGDDEERGLLRHAGAQHRRLHVHLGEQHGQCPCNFELGTAGGEDGTGQLKEIQSADEVVLVMLSSHLIGWKNNNLMQPFTVDKNVSINICTHIGLKMISWFFLPNFILESPVEEEQIARTSRLRLLRQRLLRH